MTFYDQLRNATVAMNAKWNSGAGAINIVGVRNTYDSNSNKFNDLICVAYASERLGHTVLICEGTTDPGVYWRSNLANVSGTAVLVRGHHKRLWKLGKHQGKYTALVQQSPVTVWRDSNRDRFIDIGEAQQTGMFGINLHRANEFVESTLVDKWSAGCQVVASPKQFAQLVWLAAEHARLFGNSFDYTLLHDSDVGLKWGA
jgi:hypothetical protein